jgi:hypothetical protein
MIEGPPFRPSLDHPITGLVLLPFFPLGGQRGLSLYIAWPEHENYQVFTEFL